MRRLKRQKVLLTTAAMFIALSAAFFTLISTSSVWASEGESGEVVITSPAEAAAINGSSVEVVFELRDKGSRGNHVHLYLDDKLVKPLHGRKVSYTINGLSSGKHSITIKLATKGHQVLDVTDSVTVTVR